MEYYTPAVPIPFAEVDFSTVDLGDRFIHRIDNFGCYYVQLRIFIKGKAYYGPAKTFYDNKYDGREAAYEAAIQFRNDHVYDFFKEHNYDPTLKARQSDNARRYRERERKFTIRKEAKSGLMSNLRFIKIRYNRYCILEVSVQIHGKVKCLIARIHIKACRPGSTSQAGKLTITLSGNYTIPIGIDEFDIARLSLRLDQAIGTCVCINFSLK